MLLIYALELRNQILHRVTTHVGALKSPEAPFMNEGVAGMKKEDFRREFFKLKEKDISISKCGVLLASQFGWQGRERTLERWIARLNEGDWD